MDAKIKYITTEPSEIDGIKVVNEIHEAIECVKNNEVIARYEFGTSMEPILKNGEYGIVTPVTNLETDVQIGDAVLCEVNGIPMTHMVCMKSKTVNGWYFLIGTSSMGLYGWTNKVYGLVHGTNICQY